MPELVSRPVVVDVVGGAQHAFDVVTELADDGIAAEAQQATNASGVVVVVHLEVLPHLRLTPADRTAAPCAASIRS